MINPSDASANPTNTACASALSHTFLRLQDEVPQNLCQYQGKVIMVVNTASFCGFTSQYEGLEKIYARYKDKGFVILGFPSNDFGQQEPGSNKEIAEFCKNTYDVKFPMFAKSSVSGKDANPLFKMLISKKIVYYFASWILHDFKKRKKKHDQFTTKFAFQALDTPASVKQSANVVSSCESTL